MHLVSKNINVIIKRIFAKKHPLLAEIIVNWNKIVGLKFSQNTNPFKIVTIKERGDKINILHIQVKNSAMSLEIYYQQDIILERMNVYLGFKGINKLHLVIYSTKNQQK
jgi:hypothetical protein